MMAIATYTKTGTKAATPAKLAKDVFAVATNNHELIKLAYTAYLSNGRDNLAQTKTRGLVRGGGKKPWKQKGTGRARVGSSRTPVWRGGGIVFGPTGEENYTKRISQQSKHLALRQVLSMAAKDDKIKVIEAFECKDGKVSKTAALLKKLDAKGRILLVVTQKDDLLERATRNLPELKAVHATYLNVFDILNADAIVITEDALAATTKWLEPANKPKSAGSSSK